MFSELLPPRLRAYVASFTKSHRAFVGPASSWETAGASQLDVLVQLGLRAHHTLLEIGCGSLRVGRLLIAYLDSDRYFAVEPERWLVEAALRTEIDADALRTKRPVFRYTADFSVTAFEREFDYILAGSVFSHAAQHQIAACLSQAREVMTPATRFAASFVEGDTNYDGVHWSYPEPVTYSFERMRELASASGLRCERLDFPWYAGAPVAQTWVVLTLIAAADAALG